MTTRRFQPTRIVLLTAIYALVGAIVTVLVAWVAEARVPRDLTYRWDLSVQSDAPRVGVLAVYVKDQRPGGAIIVTGRASALERVLSRIWGGDIRKELEHDRESGRLVPPRIASVPGLDPDALDYQWATNASGWPMIAMKWSIINDGARSGFTHEVWHGLEVKRSITSEGVLTVLPLMPVLPGFLVNTTLYGTGAWLVTLAPVAILRARRGKKGRCPKCSYDLSGAAGDVCPECGAKIRR